MSERGQMIYLCDDEVVIPLAQHDALMAAEEFVRNYMAAADKIGERGSLYSKGEGIIAALRAAGIEID